MQNHTMVQRRQRVRPWGCLERLLLMAFLLCFVVGLGALYLLLSINRQSAPMLFDAPKQTLQTGKIVPQLAIRHLAGDSLDGLVEQALRAGEAATGHALLLFDGATPPVTLAARWLDLAQKEAENGNQLRAAQAAQMAQRIALLDPRLQPLEKTQLLTQCAKLYATVDSAKLTTFTINQASIIAAQTPNLLPAQRSQLFAALQLITNDLKEDDENRVVKLRVDDFARNPFLAPTGLIVTPTLFSLAEATNLLDAIAPTQLSRQDAAKAFADRYQLTNGIDVEPEREALRVALLNEHSLRLQTMQQALAAATPAQKLSLLQSQREWLTIQLRVALRGYGTPLVPEWEADIPGIERELSTNATDLKAVFEQLASSQPTPQQQSLMRVEAILWLTKEYELGLFPNSSQEELAAQIQFAQTEAERLNGPLALPIIHVPSEEHLSFDFQLR